MHELGIVFHIISSLEQVGAQNHLRSISTVTLEIGEVSSVINSYLEDCWRWAADRSELLRGAADRNDSRGDPLRGLRQNIRHRGAW